MLTWIVKGVRERCSHWDQIAHSPVNLEVECANTLVDGLLCSKGSMARFTGKLLGGLHW